MAEQPAHPFFWLEIQLTGQNLHNETCVMRHENLKVLSLYFPLCAILLSYEVLLYFLELPFSS